MVDAVDTRPVGPDDVGVLTALFDTQRSTRHCWCMAFCATRGQFAAGWLTGGNRRRFRGLAEQSTHPLGVLATRAGEPVGWGACGPRSRYASALESSGSVLSERARAEDETVWLLPCLFVRAGHRGQGVSHALVTAAVELARREGARAIEGWPLASTTRGGADAFLGREQVFAELGFHRAHRPTPDRVIMRRDLTA